MGTPLLALKKRRMRALCCEVVGGPGTALLLRRTPCWEMCPPLPATPLWGPLLRWRVTQHLHTPYNQHVLRGREVALCPLHALGQWGMQSLCFWGVLRGGGLHGVGPLQIH